jgi:alpha-L-arabinofuranosidase
LKTGVLKRVFIYQMLLMLLVTSFGGLSLTGNKASAAVNFTRVESVNFPGYYWRHANYIGYLQKNVAPIQDSEFQIVAGLADSSYISFQSVNYPNYYLRHVNFQLQLVLNDNTTTFKQDASFKRVPGLSDSTKISYQSYNFPTYYIRHFNFGLRIDPISTATDKLDATFKESVPGSTASALTVTANQSGNTVSPTLYGLMTEDISHSGDGGLYAEWIQNRDFHNATTAWSVVTQNGSAGTLATDTANPLNTAQNISGKLNVTTAGAGSRAGIANSGYWGIGVKPSTTYKASFYAKASTGFSGPLTVDIESTSGTVYASATVTGLTTAWKKFNVTLTTGTTAPTSSANRFVISTNSPATVWFDMVSLFPPTYNNRANGLRTDLMQKMQAIHPSILRMPGGNFLEGQDIANYFNWKNTLGDIAQRPGHQDPWGYRSTDGLGLLEYLTWCEDLGMQPMLAVFAGFTLDKKSVSNLAPYVQDALDEIQYVTGSTSTTWGAKRAADGHPNPFPLQYVEVGNEDFFDPIAGSYNSRFTAFYDAIKLNYPQLKVIATTTVTSRTADVIDEHYYQSKDWFVSNSSKYDTYTRGATKVMVGEYAATAEKGANATGTMNDAVGEAAWMVGMERNTDLVVNGSYAPLLDNINAVNWNPNMIGFDALTSFGSPSYHVQSMFSNNTGNVLLPTTYVDNGNSIIYSVSKATSNGTVYVKAVNYADNFSSPIQITLNGVTSITSANVTSISTAVGTDSNSISNPNHIVPTTAALTPVGKTVNYTMAPNSVAVFKLITN